MARAAAALLRALILLAMVATTASAADITLRATLDPPQLGPGRAADLAVQATGAQDVPVPQVPAPRGVTVRYVGPSTELSIVNGRTNASITHHFSVIAQTPGTITLGPITVDYEGKRYDAGSVNADVLAPGAAPSSGAAAAPADEPLHLTLLMPKTDLYLHERVPIRLQLVIGNVRVTDVEYPTIDGEGFALDKFGQPSQRQDRVGGNPVQIAEFTTTLTPLRSGQLTVGPAHLNLAAITRRRGRGADPFFGDLFGGSREPVQLATEPVVLNVMPLPEAGKPPDFSGAVGKFEFDVRAAPLDLQAGDPITVTTTVRGSGNLEQLTAPTVTGADGVRVYPPQPANAGSTPVPGMRVEAKTFEQVVIPERPGPFAIPELRFSWFDPDARTYRTATHPAIPVTVRAPAGNARAPQIVGAPPAAPARNEPLGRDIVFIKDTPGTLRPIGARWYRRPLFWVYQLVPLGLWLAVVAWDRRRQRLRGDTGYARYTRAGRAARSALAAARSALERGDRVAFYDAVAAAVRDYLSAKLDLPPGSVTPEAVQARLRGNPKGTEVAAELRQLFDVCERVRFAPSADGDRDMNATLARAEDIVRRLERSRVVAPPMAAALAVIVAIGVASAITTVTHVMTAFAADATAADTGAAPRVAPGDAAGLADAAPRSRTGGADADNPSALFIQANALYAGERYADAAATYEKILGAGRESGNLYFNLGNAYFRAGDLGRAILQYERARRLIPGDPDLRANLAFARSEAGTSDEEPLYARFLFPAADWLSTDGALLVASVLYTLAMLALIAARLAPAAARASRIGAAVAAVACVVVLGSAVYRLATVDLPSYAVVVADGETTVRFEPATSGTPHFTAKRGAVLRVLAERTDWVQVARDDGQRGWTERSAIAPI